MKRAAAEGGVDAGVGGQAGLLMAPVLVSSPAPVRPLTSIDHSLPTIAITPMTSSITINRTRSRSTAPSSCRTRRSRRACTRPRSSSRSEDLWEALRERESRAERETPRPLLPAPQAGGPSTGLGILPPAAAGALPSLPFSSSFIASPMCIYPQQHIALGRTPPFILFSLSFVCFCA